MTQSDSFSNHVYMHMCHKQSCIGKFKIHKLFTVHRRADTDHIYELLNHLDVYKPQSPKAPDSVYNQV